MEYEVTVLRIAYRQKVIRVTATDIHQAKQQAMKQAVDIEFPSEHDYEYAATDVRVVDIRTTTPEAA